MADGVFQCVLLLVWISLNDALRGLTPNTYMMDRICDQTIDMRKEGIMAGKLRMTGRVSDCWVTARAPEHLNVMVSLVLMEFEEETSCTDYVLLVDGAWNSSDLAPIDVSAPMCRLKTKKKYTVTKGRELTVRYHSENVTIPGQFELLFTAVYTGPCMGTDYRCESGYCISDELRCNGHKMCGDGTGCPKMVDGGRDFRFWLAVAGGVGFLSFVAIYYIRQRRQRQQLAQTTTDPQSLPLNSLQQPSLNVAAEPQLPPAYATQYSTPGAYPPPVTTYPAAPPSYSDVEKPPL